MFLGARLPGPSRIVVTPSILAYLALVLFVPFSAVVFALLRPPTATATVLLSAVMFLPERVAFDAPGLPPLDKHSISGLCALVGCLVTASPRLKQARPGRGLDVLALLLMLSFVVTALTNRDVLVYGPRVLPGLGLYDAFSDSVRLCLSFVIPFFLGRALFRSAADLKGLMGVIVAAGVVYLPFIAVEMAMSPQMHRWVYGFHQHQFIQSIRAGGYRPVVFMHHGLALAMLLMNSCLCAFVLFKARARILFSLPILPIALALSLALVLCRSLGALVYALTLVPAVFFLRPRPQLTVAVVVAGLTFAYPVLRATDAFPDEALVDAAATAGQDRAQSLAFRFYNENQLLEKAAQRMGFGWGGHGRSRVFDEWGVDRSVTDGQWVIALGTGGVTGFILTFALLLVPIFMARRHIDRMPPGHDRMLLAGFALLVAVRGIDLLPNAMYSHLNIFFSGALAGVAKGLTRPVFAEHRHVAVAR